MAVSAYLRIDGIAGESQAQKFAGQIECVSFDLAITSSTSILGTGAAVGKASFGPLVFTKAVDTASPQIFLALAQGKFAATATLSLVQSGAVDSYATVSFKQVLFTGQETSLNNGATLETVKMAYASLQYSVAGHAPDGSLRPPVQGGWDITRNKLL